MPARRQDALLRIHCFEVLIGDRNVGFAEVSRLTSETVFPDPPARMTHRFAPVVLRRAITGSTELYDWRRLILGGKDDRRDVTIRQLSTPGGKVVNAWKLVGAWPVRWSGPAFDALKHDVACEEVELLFDDLVWLTDAKTTPTKG